MGNTVPLGADHRPGLWRKILFGLGVSILGILLPSCDGMGDSQLAIEQRLARQRVESALGGGQPDIAQQALHSFSQEVDAAERRGLAPKFQIVQAREFIDRSFERIEIYREDQKIAEIRTQLENLIVDENFRQARFFVRTAIHQLNPSERMEEHLLAMIDRVESAQIGLVEQRVRTEIARGAFALARARVNLELDNRELSAQGLERLDRLALEVDAAERGNTPVPRPPPPSPPPPSPPPPIVADAPEVFGLEFARVAAGSYQIGSPINEPGRDPAQETEPESFTLEEYYISTTEVTQEAFVRVYPRIWEHFSHPRVPAHSVSFAEAEEFCRRLTELDGTWVFTLPTEVEWEVAARARRPPSDGPINARRGDRKRFRESRDKAAFALQKYGFFRPNKQRSGPMPVQLKLSNDLGLFDMHGNVAEWCRQGPGPSSWDSISLLEQPTRGGSVLSDYERCRAAARAFERAESKKSTIGFRIIARRR